MTKVKKNPSDRKKLKKFGKLAKDEEANANIGEEVFLRFAKTQTEDPQAAELGKKQLTDKKILCRLCKGDHWTTFCPFKDKLAATEKAADTSSQKSAETTDKYVPPGMRAGSKKSEHSMTRRGKVYIRAKFNAVDDLPTLRIRNLSEDTKESDVRDLLAGFGSISRMYVSKDQLTGKCRGFAFVSFEKAEDAQKALTHLDGHGYDNLILHVEFSRPRNTE